MVMPKAEPEVQSPVRDGFYSQVLAAATTRTPRPIITIRDKSGQAEHHAAWEDHIFILDGEATMISGRHDRESARRPAPAKRAGSAIKGGKTFVRACRAITSMSPSTPRTR